MDRLMHECIQFGKMVSNVVLLQAAQRFDRLFGDPIDAHGALNAGFIFLSVSVPLARSGRAAL
eukprot:8789230-Pyramimonas_sp.AAC.1